MSFAKSPSRQSGANTTTTTTTTTTSSSSSIDGRAMPKTNLDLLERIRNFLPQIDAANQQKDNTPMDVGLMQDEDDVDVDVDEAEDESDIAITSKTAATTTIVQPSIQLELEIGSLEHNKRIFEILGTSSRNVDGDQESDNSPILDGADTEVELQPKEKAILAALEKDSNDKKKKSTKKRKVLIEEIR